MQEYIDLRDQKFSYFGDGSEFTGTFKLKGPTHISGPVEGTINMISNAELCITDTGSFTGNIVCHDIEIYGKVSAEITATGNVKIFPTALVNGTIKAKNLIIYPGAKINIDGETKAEEET